MIAVVVLPSEADGAGDEDRPRVAAGLARCRETSSAASGTPRCSPARAPSGRRRAARLAIRLSSGSARGSAAGRGGAAAPRGAGGDRAPASRSRGDPDHEPGEQGGRERQRAGAGRPGLWRCRLGLYPDRRVGAVEQDLEPAICASSDSDARPLPSLPFLRRAPGAGAGPRRSARAAIGALLDRRLGEGVRELGRAPRASSLGGDRDEIREAIGSAVTSSSRSRGSSAVSSSC